MIFKGYTIKNYRGIGPEGIFLNPLSKINIIVGKNNSGKSSVINAIKIIDSKLFDNIFQFSDIDFHNRDQENQFSYQLDFSFDPKNDKDLFEIFGNENCYFRWSYGGTPNANFKMDDCFLFAIKDIRVKQDITAELFQLRWNGYVNHDQVNQEIRDRIENTFKNKFLKSIPRISIIPEFRTIGLDDTDYELDGTGLAKLLSNWNSPPIGSDNLKDKYSQITESLSELLRLNNPVFEFRRDMNYEIIINETNRLPLSSYGAGVRDLLILLTAAITNQRKLICIEEPDIHMHPSLQKELIKFLIQKTNNTYLFSTHSPALLNIPNDSDVPEDSIQIFHILKTNGVSKGFPVFKSTETQKILSDIGIKGSDIIQPNCLIWVEGPSDRIYIKHWISLINPKLIEGKHYSVVFYGGCGEIRNFSAGVVEDKSNKDLLDIVSINHNVIFVSDSDKQNEEGILNPNLLRIKQLIESNNGIVWISHGRSIENYLSEKVIKKGFRKITGRSKIKDFNIGKFDDFSQSTAQIMDEYDTKSKKYRNHKVSFAREFVQFFDKTDMSIELRNTIQLITNKIEEWNNY